jgi:branched-chain amino acid transport system ATP-binding protein
MTVTENLELGGWLSPPRLRNERLARAFEDFPRLKERATQLAGTMSGGEQQMVAVARAMMSGPRLLMLDEPSLGLAPRMVDELLTIVRRIAAQGVTVLMVEQNVRMALLLAQYGYVIKDGVIHIEGPAENLIHDDTSTYPAVRSPIASATLNQCDEENSPEFAAWFGANFSI